MPRQITVVYQDCYLCGDRGRKRAAILAKKGVILRKVGFSTKEGSELIHEALFKHKIGTMPFYVEDNNYATSLEEILKTKETKKTTRKKRTTKKKVEEAKDGSISEN